jgi:hypothetical protein
MDNTLQTSFIPKQTIVARPTVSGGGGMGLLTTLSFVILLISLLLAGGTYLYQQYLISHIYGACQGNSQGQPNTAQLGVSGGTNRSCGLYLSLDNKKSSLDEQRLYEMERLDTKMKLASSVLSNHITLTPLFDLLGANTLKTIRFNKFSSDNGIVKLSGMASSYEDVAVESNIVNKIAGIKDPSFSGLNLDDKGNVVFQLSFSIDPSHLRYNSTTVNPNN